MNQRFWSANSASFLLALLCACTQSSGGRSVSAGGALGGGMSGGQTLSGSNTAGTSAGGTIMPDAGPDRPPRSTDATATSAGSSGGLADADSKTDTSSVGGSASGGVSATVSANGGKTMGGSNATGTSANGGMASSATGAAGSSGSTESCGVGVYEATSPPKVLTLTGNLGAHDPAAIAGDGTYYLYQTGLGAKTSKDLTSWAAAGKPLATPAWMSTTIPGVGDLWAPDVSFFGGQYHLYYAGSTFGSNKSCIGHATRQSLATGSWVDSGAATLCSNLGSSDDWNAIDANVVLDSAGTPWLAFGSFWGGLKLVQLDSAGNRVGTKYTSIAARPNTDGALEAPFIVRRCGYFYLFMSWDKCCDGVKSTYNIRVARATSVTGPYSDKAGTAALQGGGTLITEGDDTWAGPGGQSVMMVGQRAYLVYHAYAKSDGAATLRIADLVWDTSGWPVPVGP